MTDEKMISTVNELQNAALEWSGRKLPCFAHTDWKGQKTKLKRNWHEIIRFTSVKKTAAKKIHKTKKPYLTCTCNMPVINHTSAEQYLRQSIYVEHTTITYRVLFFHSVLFPIL